MGMKSELLKTYVSEDTRDKIEKQAEKHGLDLSAYVRMQIKKQLPQEATA